MDRTDERQDPTIGSVESGRALLFAVGERQYAVPVALVAGLAECGSIHKVPRAPLAVFGLAEWRGHVITVIDLPRLLGHPISHEPACLVRLTAPVQRIALLAPATLRTTSLPTPLDAVEDRAARHAFSGRFSHDGQTVWVIDPIALVRLAETGPKERD